MSVRPSPSIKSEEVARFEALGDTWWDPEGPMAPLHRINPIRIGWARDLIVRHFKLETQVGAPLAGIDLLDVGCGAGLFAEPLARLGANVVGVDPAPAAIEAARHHAEETGRQARLSHGHGRGAGGGAAAFRCRERDGGDRARRRSETLRRDRRLARQARRPFARLDSQPHA